MKKCYRLPHCGGILLLFRRQEDKIKDFANDVGNFYTLKYLIPYVRVYFVFYCVQMCVVKTKSAEEGGY